MKQAVRPSALRSVLIALLVVGATVPALLLPAGATAAFTFDRFSGQDRDDTARLIATGTFPNGSNTVLLARNDDFPDALAGSFLAGQPASAILLTNRTSLSPITGAALATLKTKNVVLLGGTTAISATVENQLKATNSTSASGGTLNVTRMNGTTRYDTARLIASSPGTTIGSVSGKKTAIVTNGLNFPDATSGGPMAFASRLPILPTHPGSLSPETRSALTSLGIQHVLLLGGPAAVTDPVKAEIEAINGITVQRLFGQDRAETAAVIANFELASLGFVNNHVNLANGANFPDAITGGPHAGVEKAPILLTLSPSLLGTATSAWLQGHSATLTKGHIFGGPVAVSPLIADQAATDAGGASSTQRVDVGPVDVANPHVTDSAHPGGGFRTCTAKIPAAISAVDVALFSTPAISTDLNGSTVFADSDGNGRADLGAGTGGVIRSVNGSENPASPDSNYVDNVSVTGGAISFVIDSGQQDDVTAVVFADTNSDNGLALTGAGTTPKVPSEVFGIGCRTRWIPDEYHPGPIIGMGEVTYVNKVANLFVATTPDAAGGATFFYKDDDSDQLSIAPSPEPTAAGFEAVISPKDTVKGNYRFDPSAPSQLSVSDIGPAVITNPKTFERGTTAGLAWARSSTPNTDAVQIARCLATSPCSSEADFVNVATVPAWMTSYTDTGLTVDVAYQYRFRAVDEGDISNEPNATASVFARATDKPLIDQTRVSTDAAPAGSAGSGDVHTFVFSEPMNASTAANGSTYRVRDNDATPTIVDIACGAGAGANACVLAGDGRSMTVTLGTALSTVQAGTTADLLYPATIINVGAEWVDRGTDSDGGTPLDLAGSPDKTIETDSTAPTISDARATADSGLVGVSGPGDGHQFIFSEPMATPGNTTTYSVKGANNAADTVSCDQTPPTHNTCSLNNAPVTIGATTYEAGRVLTVTIQAGPGLATYPLTITATNDLTDAAGNDVNLGGGSDVTIQVAANP
jgi:putative cell wall-binding protein